MKFIFFTFLSALSLATPKPNLSETSLYAEITTKKIHPNNRLFSPQYPLWTDGASKKRWIYLPKGKQIDSSDEDQWIFPVGTKIWKEFSFNQKRVETRLIEKTADEEWEFATYLWNEAETEAVLAPEDGVENYFPVSETVKHSIPSITECNRCHKKAGDPVMGFDAIQLSLDRDPHALHKENLEPTMVTLKTLIEGSILSKVSMNIQTASPKIPGSNEKSRSLLGYLHSNCASCHNPQGSSKHVGLNLNHLLSATTEQETLPFKTSVNKTTKVFTIPGTEQTFRVLPQKPEESALVYLMETNGSSHMPPIGTKILDTQAITLLKAWINSL